MAEFTYGPVELYLVAFEGDQLSPEVISSLTEVLQAGTVRLLDLVIISKDDAGTVTVTEVADDLVGFGIEDLSIAASGIAGEDDIEELAERILPGESAALVALEMQWARRLADRLNNSGAVVLHTERVPAPVVNALVDIAQNA